MTNLANDNTGNHTHVLEETCVKPGCEKTTCLNLCDKLKGSEIKGHRTHKPPIGRFTRYVAPVDANGQAESQYFVGTNKPVKLSPTEKQNYNNEIKPYTKHQNYIEKHRDTYDKE